MCLSVVPAKLARRKCIHKTGSGRGPLTRQKRKNGVVDEQCGPESERYRQYLQELESCACGRLLEDDCHQDSQNHRKTENCA